MKARRVALLLLAIGCRPYETEPQSAQTIDVESSQPVLHMEAPPREFKLPTGAVEFKPGAGIGGERVSGDPNIGLTEPVRKAMTMAGTKLLLTRIEVCRDPSGVPRDITVLQPIATPDFDSHYRAEIRKWRYSPYLIEGKAVEACSIVTFNYQLE